ncbi:MAG: hypothetical protein II375_04135 [Bacteroidales bacterium]|nr:hypothetical protein [Bacteroidales bacterium]
MKKLALLLCLFLLAAPAAYSQKFGKLPRFSKRKMSRCTRYVDLSVGAGYHGLRTDLNDGGDGNGRFGLTIGAQYRNAYKPTLHFAMGIGASIFSTRSKYDNLVVEEELVHPDNGETYTFKTEFRYWEEIQRTINVEVPFGVYYTNYLGQSIWKIMVGGGVRLEVPIVKKFKTDNSRLGKMTISGYFPSTNVEYEDLENHGFYSRNEYAGKADTKSIGVSAFTDIGFSHPLTNERSFYVGIYFSHGILSVTNGSSSALYTPDNRTYNGVLSSNLVNKAYEMSVGFKAAYTFGFR